MEYFEESDRSTSEAPLTADFNKPTLNKDFFEEVIMGVAMIFNGLFRRVRQALALGLDPVNRRNGI